MREALKHAQLEDLAVQGLQLSKVREEAPVPFRPQINRFWIDRGNEEGVRAAFKALGQMALEAAVTVSA